MDFLTGVMGCFTPIDPTLVRSIGKHFFTPVGQSISSNTYSHLFGILGVNFSHSSDLLENTSLHLLGNLFGQIVIHTY